MATNADESSDPMIGAPTTPAMAASIMPITHAQRDVVRSFTPRVWARSARSTTARIRRPSGVWRISTHNPTATTSAAMNTDSSLESKGTSPGNFQSTLGTGPTPDGKPTWSTSELLGIPNPKVLTSWSLIQVMSAGKAMSRPTVAMIFADSVARASGRNTATSRSSPSSGAKTSTTNAAAGTIGQCRPVLSW